jgi:hypothetical protein
MVRLQKPVEPSQRKDRSAFLAEYKEAVHALGPEHCILSEELTFQSSDFASHHLNRVAPFLQALGLSEHEADLMLKENPARLFRAAAAVTAHDRASQSARITLFGRQRVTQR